MIFDKILCWLIKRLVFIWDRKNDKTVLALDKDEDTSYVIMVERHYKDYFTFGPTKYILPKRRKTNDI